MSEPAKQPREEYRVENPKAAMEKAASAMRHMLTVSKPEILRREAQYRKERKEKKKDGN